MTVALLEEQHPYAACYYLNFLGVDPARHGGGLGSTLLAATATSRAARVPGGHQPTRNRRIYERHGFKVVGEIVLPASPSLWPMWRTPRR